MPGEAHQPRRRRALRPAQIAAAPYLERVRHPALLLEMRLGKCLSTIRRLRRYAPRSPGQALRFLIVAPSSAISSWVSELAAEGEAARTVLLEGPGPQRAEVLEERFRQNGAARPAWFLLNKEGHLILPEIAEKPWDAVVLDESTFIKNPRAQVTKFFLKNFRTAPHRWILTGTINPESDADVWCQLAFLDDHAHAFGCRSYWAFLTKYYRKVPYGWGWVPRCGTQSRIRQELARHACIIRREDVGADVPKVYQRRVLQMPPVVRTTYNSMEAEFVRPLPAGQPGQPEETKYAATRYHWLRQLCGGFIGEHLTWPGKQDELVYLLHTELRRQALVVWFAYNRELLAANARLGAEGITSAVLYGNLSPRERRETVEAFARRGCQVLLVQQAVAQMGMNLSRADTAIYYSTPLGALARQQTEDRIIDTERKTTHLIIDLVVPNTVDEDAVDLVREKGARGQWSLQRARALAVARQKSSRRYQ